MREISHALALLHEVGCEIIFEDMSSGAKADRPGLRDALTYMRAGDTLVFWKLDRVSRSLRHLLELAADFKERGIGFKSLKDEIDTTTSMGKFFFHLMGAVAELERDIIRERTRRGLPLRAHVAEWEAGGRSSRRSRSRWAKRSTPPGSTRYARSATNLTVPLPRSTALCAQ